MAGALGKFDYVSDDGNTYIVRLDASNANAFGSVVDTGRPNLPHGYRMRYLECVDDADTTGGRVPSRRVRKIYATDPTDTQWVGSANVIILPDFGVTPSVAVNWTIRARVGEKRYGR